MILAEKAREPGRRSLKAGSEPLVSVIVPCHGYGHLLRGCVESVLAQEGVRLAVLIVDDLSPDGAFDIASGIARRDGRVQVRRHERNRGLIATANEGLRWADGEYVLLLSADDLLTPGSLRRATETMRAHPDVGMVYGRALYAQERRPLPRARGRWRATAVWRGTEWVAQRCRTAQNCISSPEVLVRASVQRAAGFYDDACTHASDLNMWLRVAAISDVAHIRGVPQAIYRVHGDSMLRSQRDPVRELRERRVAFERFFARPGPRLRDADRLRADVSMALARQAVWQASRAVDRGEDEQLVTALCQFALQTCPRATSLREWHGLRLRKAIGAGRSGRFLPLLATGAAHRLKGEIERAHWRLTGL